MQEEEERQAKEEQEKREEEEYLKLKASFIIEDQGEEEQLSEDQVRSLLTAEMGISDSSEGARSFGTVPLKESFKRLTHFSNYIIYKYTYI